MKLESVVVDVVVVPLLFFGTNTKNKIKNRGNITAIIEYISGWVVV